MRCRAPDIRALGQTLEGGRGVRSVAPDARARMRGDRQVQRVAWADENGHNEERACRSRVRWADGALLIV